MNTWDVESVVIWDSKALKDTKLLFLYDVNKKEYVRPSTLGVYGGLSSKIKSPLLAKSTLTNIIGQS